ncbi:DNA polymerase [Patescibacteria group bacterium]
MSKLIIIDGNALLHRAYHAIQPLTDSKGRVVNALFGFSRVLIKIIKDMEPGYLTVCWDRKEKTFRHKAYEEYKATRKEKPQELYDQIEMINELLDAYSIPHYDKVGYEADDLLGTIAKNYKNKVDEVLIATGDMDALQLVDEKIKVLTFVRGVSETIIYDVAAVQERYGLTPEQLVDYKALMGDPSDNIKGVKGIGKTGAQKLIQAHSSVEKLYKDLEKDKVEASEKVKNTLREGKGDAIKSRELVEIVKDVPIKMTLEEMKFGNYKSEDVQEFFVDFGFRSLLVQAGFGDGKADATGLEKIDSLDKLKNFIKKTKEELSFLIIEGQEGLFGKKIQEIYLASGNGMAKINFSPKFKSETALKELKLIFENSEIKKTSHDLKSQMYILDRAGIGLKGLYFDTMLSAYALNPGTRRYGLDALALDYLKKQLSKNIILDLVNLKNLLLEKIKKEKMERILFDIEMPLVPVLFRAEKVGIKIDKEMLAGLSADFEKRLNVIDKKIYKLAGKEFNIDSPQQLKEILYDKLGLKPESGRIKKGKTGLSTAASELAKLSGTHEIIDFISEHRELAKLKNTYIDALPKLLDKKDRVHTSFNQTVTSTGRLSSSGPNVQNIPIRTEVGRQIRKAV